MKRWFSSVGAVCLLGCSVTAIAADSDNPQIDIAQRARGAKKVIVAKATSVVPTWRRNAHGDEIIVSEVMLQVEETIKGARESVVLMEVEGGTLGGVTLRVSGLPEMKTGDRGVFFLDEPVAGAHVPHGRGEGILKLDADRVRGTGLRVSDVRRMAK